MSFIDPFDLVGTIVDGRYRVERVAGQGGFGVVYRAFHLVFESAVALKVLKLSRHLASENKNVQVARFQREGKLLFELSSLHPSIVKAFETGVIASSDGTVAPYLALEWLDGISLDAEIKYRRRHRIDPMILADVMQLLHDPAMGLAIAHSRGIVHRDLKPGNLFIVLRRGQPLVKVLDFGIAKIFKDSMSVTAQLENTGRAPSSFTPMYAAPEQWLRRLGATGTWTDVHALALVCLELMTGRPPLIGEDSPQLMAACLDPAVRPTPRNQGLEFPLEIENVFARAVALNPRDRFRDVGEFWSALRHAAQWSPEQALGKVEIAAPQDAAWETSAGSTEPERSSSIDGSAPEAARPTTSRDPKASGQLRAKDRRWIPRGLGAALALAVAAIISPLVLAPFRDSKGGPPMEPTDPSHQDVDLARDIVATSAPGVPVLVTQPEPDNSAATPNVPPPARNQRRLDRRSGSGGSGGRGQAPSPAAQLGPMALSEHSSPDSQLAPLDHDRGLLDTDGGVDFERLIQNEELVHRR